MPAAGYQDFLKDLLVKASLQGNISLCELALYVALCVELHSIVFRQPSCVLVQSE